MDIPSPQDIRNHLPIASKAADFLDTARSQAKQIIYGPRDNTTPLALLVGPCSIHNPEIAIEYALRLKKLSKKVKNLFLVMRLFLEKPRTRAGWKGLIYDPHLNGTNDIATGLFISRKLLLSLAELGIPCATELLEPLIVPYLEDLLTWGMIGARTSASQPHRQLSSGLSFPVGFKNGIHGNLDVAICGILSARLAHSHISIDDQGKICAKQTQGNPFSHLVLRGSDTSSNYDRDSIGAALRDLQNNHLEPRILIDCSHGNSKKDHFFQATAFKSTIEQFCEGNGAIIGLMLESNLFAGKQPLYDNLSELKYGISITDSCIGWEETESLILWADEKISYFQKNTAQNASYTTKKIAILHS